MIVSSMTVQQIHKELFEDMKDFDTKFNYCLEDFKKTVLKASRYPLSKSYDCITRKKKNLFVLTYTAMKRSHWKNPFVKIYGIYNRPEGSYAAVLTLDMKFMSIYPPHFFKRYRERILKDESISNNDLIRHYFKNDWGLLELFLDQTLISVYDCFEKDNQNDKVDFVGVSREGYCFGEKQGNINIVKTIVSEEMLFDDQKPLFRELKKTFLEAYQQRNGV